MRCGSGSTTWPRSSRRSATTSSATRPEHVTPEELGVRIRTHPKLAITAAAKMRTARAAQASYSGRRIQTILFNHRDRWLETNNRAAAGALVEAAGPDASPMRPGITVVGPVDSRAVSSSSHLPVPREQPRSRWRADQPVHPRPPAGRELTISRSRSWDAQAVRTISARSTSASATGRLHQPGANQGRSATPPTPTSRR